MEVRSALSVIQKWETGDLQLTARSKDCISRTRMWRSLACLLYLRQYPPHWSLSACSSCQGTLPSIVLLHLEALHSYLAQPSPQMYHSTSYGFELYIDATDPVRLDASEPCCAPARLGIGVMSASLEERSSVVHVWEVLNYSSMKEMYIVFQVMIRSKDYVG